MPQIKVQVDSKEAKNSIVDLATQLKAVTDKTRSVTLIDKKQEDLIKKGISKELEKVRQQLKSSKSEMLKLVKAGEGLEKGSKKELENRKKINDTVKKQSTLMGRLKGFGGGGFGGGGGGMGMLAKGAMGLAGGAIMGLAGAAVGKGLMASSQYASGASNRVRLQGLGLNDGNNGSAANLSSLGLTTQDMISRRAQVTSQLGRGGSSTADLLQQSRFERSFGLNSGTLANSSTSLRANFGGSGANQAQMELQASVLASGLEDSIGPYLETATTLLNSINENGMTSSTEMLRIFGKLVKEGGRTPEQISKIFGGINSGIKGSSGESNAFLQNAFSRSGIGGGALGATQMAIESGGLFGLDAGSLSSRGYNKDLISNMQSSGMVGNTSQRMSAILDEFKISGGLGKDQKIGDITDVSQMSMMSMMGNSIFGTSGMQGFEALQLLEKAESGGISDKKFKESLKDLQGKTEETGRLDKINESLAGQTEIIRNMSINLSEVLGEKLVPAINKLIEVQNQLVDGGTKGVSSVTDGKVSGSLDRLTSWLANQDSQFRPKKYKLVNPVKNTTKGR